MLFQGVENSLRLNQNLMFVKRLSKFPNDYLLKLIIVSAVYLIFQFLASYIGFNEAYLSVVIVSALFTILIWRKEGYLNELKFHIKYPLYYSVILFLALTKFPQEPNFIFKVLFDNGIREELFYRFFMIGIFMKYFYDKKFSTYFLVNTTYVYTNVLFIVAHNESLINLIYLFGIGILFSITYLYCGLLSAILFHTMHNLYLPKDYPIISLLCIVPVVFEEMKKHYKKQTHAGILDFRL